MGNLRRELVVQTGTKHELVVEASQNRGLRIIQMPDSKELTMNSKTIEHIQFEIMNLLWSDGKFIGNDQQEFWVMVFLDAARKRLSRILGLRIELILDQAHYRYQFSFRIKVERGTGIPID